MKSIVYILIKNTIYVELSEINLLVFDQDHAIFALIKNSLQEHSIKLAGLPGTNSDRLSQHLSGCLQHSVIERVRTALACIFVIIKSHARGNGH